MALLKIQPFAATLILMVAGRGIAQLISQGQIVTFNSDSLGWFVGSGSLWLMPVWITLLVWLLTRKTT